MAAKKRKKKRKKQKIEAKLRRQLQDLQRKHPISPPASASGQREEPAEPSPPTPAEPPAEPSPPTPTKPSAPEAAELPEEVDFSYFWEPTAPKDPDKLIAGFQAQLNTGEMNADDAFEWLLDIREALGDETPEARARFAAVVEQLRQQAPEAYEEHVGLCTEYLLSDAIVEGRWDEVPALVRPLVENPDKAPDAFFKILDQLLYHGRIPILLDVVRRAWPAVKDSGEFTPWAVDEFAGKALLVELFAYLETAEQPRADDPALREATAPYAKWDEEWLQEAVLRLTLPAPSAWQRADFGERVDADQWRRNVHALLLEFIADRWRAGIPLTRAYMAVTELEEFVNWQFSNPTVPGAPKKRRQTRRGRRRRKREETARFPLLPDEVLLDRFLTERFPALGFGAQPYQVAALMELLPAYLYFLARLNVIHPVEMDEALEGVTRRLVPHLPRVLRSYGADEVAVQNMVTAWSEESLAALRDDPALAAARAAPLPAPEAPVSVPSPRPGAVDVYTFKVTYLRDPDIWRVIEMRGDQTLDDLHYAIQDAVDFDADHLYSFFMSGRAWDKTTEYASPYTEGRSAARVRIRDLRLRPKQRFLYLFDYGDEHRFEVQLLDVNPEGPKGKYPRIVERHGPNPEQYGWWDEEEEWDEEWEDEEWEDDEEW